MPMLTNAARHGHSGAAAWVRAVRVAPVSDATETRLGAETLRAADPAALTRSRCLEPMAATAMMISPCRLDVLGILLGATVPGTAGGDSVLQPLWVHEAIQRAFAFTRLVTALDGQCPLGDADAGPPDREITTATRLAGHYLGLPPAQRGDKHLTPCAAVLRDLAQDLVALFAPAVGQVSLTLSVDALALPGFQCRALILLASELICNCLLHAFARATDGHITVRLNMRRNGVARLSVEDNRHWQKLPGRDGTQGDTMRDDLADLLLSHLVYLIDPRGTRAEISFPAGAEGSSRSECCV